MTVLRSFPATPSHNATDICYADGKLFAMVGGIEYHVTPMRLEDAETVAHMIPDYPVGGPLNTLDAMVSRWAAGL